MMKESALILDLYGIWGNRSLTITQFPCTAKLTFEVEGKPYCLRILSPSSFAELTKFLDGECCGIAIFNRNALESMYLEFGRYRVVLSSEDGPIGSLDADKAYLENEAEMR